MGPPAALFRTNADRYGQVEEWFLWCHRTEKGELDDADRAMAKRVNRPTRQDKPRELAVKLAVRFLLRGEDDVAARNFANALHQHNDAWAGLHLALIRHRGGDPAARDAALKDVLACRIPRRLESSATPRPQLVKLAALYRDACGGKPPDPRAVATLCAATQGNEQRNLYYFAGSMYACYGDSANAVNFLNCAAHPVDAAMLNCTLAWVQLRQLGARIRRNRSTARQCEVVQIPLEPSMRPTCIEQLRNRRRQILDQLVPFPPAACPL